MLPIVSITDVSKVYADGFEALRDINLEIHRGEIFSLLGPNGAGKTTLIGTICGLVSPTKGQILVDGLDIHTHYRVVRQQIGLVPQELTTDAFETVWNTVSFSRGLFGLKANSKYIEQVLKSLSLWDKKDNMLRTLSGGMKRRVMIAKALSHEPKLLFLDEPSAGVDVRLRKDMWDQVRALRASGVSILLTTHYIEEAEEMADRIGVINKGSLVLVDDKQALMKKLGKKQLILDLKTPLTSLPEHLNSNRLVLDHSGCQLTYTYDTQNEQTGISELLKKLSDLNIICKDLRTHQSSLEDIFVDLVKHS